MHDTKHTLANGLVGMVAGLFGFTASVLTEIEITLRIILAFLSICVMAITLRNLIRGKRPGDGPGVSLHPLSFVAALGLTLAAAPLDLAGFSLPDLAQASSPILLALVVNFFAMAMKRVPERFVPDWTIPFSALVLGAVLLPALEGWTVRNAVTGFASGGLAVGLNQALRQGVSAFRPSTKRNRTSK